MKNDIWKDYSEKKLLFQGNYSLVYKAKNKQTGEYVAIKEIKKDNFKINIKDLNKTIEKMKKINSNNFINIREIIDVNHYFYIIMDLCLFDLDNYLQKKDKPLSIIEIKVLFFQINNALKILYNEKIIHGNFKFSNILINLDNNHNITIKLSYLDSIMYFEKLENSLSNKSKSFFTTPPEILKGNIINNKSDIWSLGVIMYYMLFKKYPYEGKTEYDLIKNIQLKPNLEIKSEDNDLNDLLIKMIKLNANDRISFEEYFEHPFFKFININKEEESKDNNFIICEHILSKTEINKNTYILNYIDYIRKKKLEMRYKELNINDLTFDINNNEINGKNCEMYINDKLIDFSIIYKFPNEGKYKIKIVFKKQLTNISYMFCYCTSLRYINLLNFNSNNITNISCLFIHCSSLISLDLSKLNTSNVINMNGIFQFCSSLKSINLSNFNTNNVKNMNGMFESCSSLTSLNLSKFNTKNVTNMSYMFSGCSSLISLDLSNFNTINVTNMKSMFKLCSSLTSLNLSNFNTNNVIDMSFMFSECTSLNFLNLSNFDIINVIDMTAMFQKCSSLKYLDLSNFNTKNVKNMYAMFKSCSSLNHINLSNFNTSNVIDMKSIFSECSSLTSINLSKFDTSLVSNMDFMFNQCSSLKSLEISNFNTKTVVNMNQMFQICSSLTNLDLSNFDTSNVINMEGMFSGCYSLTSLNLSNFNTINVTNMKNMFAKCKSLTSLNLTIFNTNNVTDMDNMFYECSSLDYLDISNFNIENVINKEKIFYKLKKDCKIIYNDNKINKLIS